MNKQIKPTVYRILKEDKQAREDDWYLIFKTLQEILPCGQGTAFGSILQGMRYKGISFEAITRARRKFFEENPQYRELDVENIRRQEEEKYYTEYGNHIPRLD
jgi:hypothetical protein